MCREFVCSQKGWLDATDATAGGGEATGDKGWKGDESSLEACRHSGSCFRSDTGENLYIHDGGDEGETKFMSPEAISRYLGIARDRRYFRHAACG